VLKLDGNPKRDDETPYDFSNGRKKSVRYTIEATTLPKNENSGADVPATAWYVKADGFLDEVYQKSKLYITNIVDVVTGPSETPRRDENSSRDITSLVG
jgi:hypothetical protein